MDRAIQNSILPLAVSQYSFPLCFPIPLSFAVSPSFPSKTISMQQTALKTPQRPTQLEHVENIVPTYHIRETAFTCIPSERERQAQPERQCPSCPPLQPQPFCGSHEHDDDLQFNPDKYKYDQTLEEEPTHRSHPLQSHHPPSSCCVSIHHSSNSHIPSCS